MQKSDNLRIEIYRKMTPIQKWKEVCKLRETAWNLKAAAIRKKYPHWSEPEVQNEVRKIFLYAVT